jgi:hypothetical protein
MRRTVMLVALALAWAAPSTRLSAQSAENADAPQIRETIRSQLEAFKEDNGERAYSFAAPNVKAIFPSVETFMTMVKRGYQPVYRPKSYSFGPLETKSGILTQTVEILGPDGDYWQAIYTLEREEDGSWKITGCRLVRDEGGAA